MNSFKPKIRELVYEHITCVLIPSNRRCKECHKRIEPKSFCVAIRVHVGWIHPLCFINKAKDHAVRGELIALHTERVWSAATEELLTNLDPSGVFPNGFTLFPNGIPNLDLERVKNEWIHQYHFFNDSMKVVNDLFYGFHAKRGFKQRIRNMNYKELKQAASERMMSPVGNKSEMIAWLQEFSRQPGSITVLQEDADKSVIGYVREFRKQSSRNIPTCVERLIVMYHPAFYL